MVNFANWSAATMCAEMIAGPMASTPIAGSRAMQAIRLILVALLALALLTIGGHHNSADHADDRPVAVAQETVGLLVTDGPADPVEAEQWLSQWGEGNAATTCLVIAICCLFGLAALAASRLLQRPPSERDSGTIWSRYVRPSTPSPRPAAPSLLVLSISRT